MNKIKNRSVRRRGLSSVLAMLYLVLFSTLAVGFAAGTAINAQISKNERFLQQADSAADGGMQFIRYQLGAMTIPPGTTTAQLLQAAANSLGTQLNGSTNMGGNRVQVTTVNGNSAIFIPSATSWMTVDQSVGTRFRAMIQQSGQFFVVTVDGAGTSGIVEKAIQMQYQLAPKAGAILDYGVATEGTLSTGNSTVIQGLTDPTKGSVLSADMTSTTPVVAAGTISGDISIVNPNASINATGSVGQVPAGSPQIAQHEHVGVPPPTFPTIDTSPFTAFVDVTNPANAYTGNGTCTNCYIPPGTNPSFSSGQINGVMVVLTPNKVSIQGNTVITGVIVGQNGQTFDPNNNTITFAGSVTVNPISSLQPGMTGYVSGLPQLTGSFLLMPAFYVKMTGDMGTVSGSIVGGQIAMTGNSHPEAIQGSVIGMQDVPMTLSGHADITVSSTGTTNFPTGMSFGNDYTPLPGTYMEVAPW